MGEQPQESLALPPPRDAALLVVALAGVSASGPIMAATAAPALAIAFWRNLFGAGATSLAAVRRWRQFAAVDPRTWRVAVLAGGLLALHFGTWVPSLGFTSVASATALVSTQAIFSALYATTLGRRLPRAAWFGMVLAVVGTALIAGADLGTSTRALAGDALAVAGGAAAAGYVTAGARARRTMSAAAYTAVCYSVCSVGLLGACLIGRLPLGGYPARAWVLIVAVTVSAQILGHTLINVVLRSASATFVGLAILIETPGAAVIAAVWLHQTPQIWAVPGLVLLLCGLVLTVRAKAPEPLSPADVD
ncbi:MAG: DMT family transporter [Actinomycetota bacterium]|nr:DMT family transporter [Actinomycetota bacterium]